MRRHNYFKVSSRRRSKRSHRLAYPDRTSQLEEQLAAGTTAIMIIVALWEWASFKKRD